MANEIRLQSICPNMHVTETEFLDAVVNEDGSMDGVAGSDADFCIVCGVGGLEPMSLVEIVIVERCDG